MNPEVSEINQELTENTNSQSELPVRKQLHHRPYQDNNVEDRNVLKTITTSEKSYVDCLMGLGQSLSDDIVEENRTLLASFQGKVFDFFQTSATPTEIELLVRVLYSNLRYAGNAIFNKPNVRRLSQVSSQRVCGILMQTQGVQTTVVCV